MPHPADQAMPHILQLPFLASDPVSHFSTSAHSHMDMMQPENQMQSWQLLVTYFMSNQRELEVKLRGLFLSFWDRVSVSILCLPWTCDPPFFLGITDMYYYRMKGFIIKFFIYSFSHILYLDCNFPLFLSSQSSHSNPVFLHFPSEKGNSPRDITKTWHMKLHKTRHLPSYWGLESQPSRRKMVPEAGNRIRGSPHSHS